MRSSALKLLILCALCVPESLPAKDVNPASRGKAATDHDDTKGKTTAMGPRAVVTRWLEMRRAGNRSGASKLTTESRRQAVEHLTSKRIADVRVDRSLGNERAAAVVASSPKDAQAGKRLLLFWLRRRDGAWRINKATTVEKRVVEERLRGFLEAGDVRWHLERGQLLGTWLAGPCRPPGSKGIACGNQLQLGADNRYRLTAWGPTGPHPESDDVTQGTWRLTGDRILLSHRSTTHKCRVVWMTGNVLVIDSLDGQYRARYKK